MFKADHAAAAGNFIQLHLACCYKRELDVHSQDHKSVSVGRHVILWTNLSLKLLIWCCEAILANHHSFRAVRRIKPGIYLLLTTQSLAHIWRPCVARVEMQSCVQPVGHYQTNSAQALNHHNNSGVVIIAFPYLLFMLLLLFSKTFFQHYSVAMGQKFTRKKFYCWSAMIRL